MSWRKFKNTTLAFKNHTSEIKDVVTSTHRKNTSYEYTEKAVDVSVHLYNFRHGNKYFACV